MLEHIHGESGLHLILGEVVLLGQLGDLLGAVLVGDLHVLGSGHGIQGQLQLHLTQSGGLSGSTHHLGSHAHHLQVVVHGHALALHAHGVLVHHLVQLGLHHAVGDLSLQVVDELLQNGALESALSLGLTALLELLAQVLLEVSQGLKLRHILSELVVRLRDLGLLDLLDLHVEHHSLAGQILHIVLGEGDVQILLIAHAQANELILKAGHEGAGADLQAVIGALAALEGLAIVKALEVDDSSIAHGDGTLHAHQTSGTLDIGLQLILDVGIGDLVKGLGSLQALILAQLHLGAHGDQSSKGQAVLAHLHDVHDRVAHILQALLLHSSLIGAGVHIVDGVFIKHAGAVHALDDLPGGLALTEAGDADAVAVLQISLLNGSLKLAGLHLDGQLHCALFFLLNVGDLHVTFPPVSARDPSVLRTPCILSPWYFTR